MAEWDTSQVLRWLQGLGLHSYADDFKFHRITGNSLMAIDHWDLEEVGVRSFGHRVQLLAAINKHLQRAGTNLVQASPAALAQQVAELQLKLKKLTDSHNRLRQDMLPVIRRVKQNEPLPRLAVSSPTVTAAHGRGHSPHGHGHGHGHAQSHGSRRGPASPLDTLHEHTSRSTSRHPTTPLSERPNRLGLIEEDPDPAASGLNGPLVHAQVKNGAPISLSTASEPFKSFRVTLEDPCTKVLPAVLKKYRIQDDPGNYRLLVSYSDRERELRADEKPLHVFKELQDAGLRPVFMVRQLVKGQVMTPSGRVTPGGVI